jgi:hypothetical protein
MDLKKLKADYDKLVTRQLIISEGIMDLEEIQKDLNSNVSSAQFWGNLAVVMHAALIPLNVIVNAFEVKAATSIYQTLVKNVYAKFAASGSKTQGPSKAVLDILKKTVTDHLKSQGLKEYIPGVNILVGFAQDSIALYQVSMEVKNGSSEQDNLTRKMNNSIEKAKKELMKLGVERAYMHQQMGRISSVA